MTTNPPPPARAMGEPDHPDGSCTYCGEKGPTYFVAGWGPGTVDVCEPCFRIGRSEAVKLLDARLGTVNGRYIR